MCEFIGIILMFESVYHDSEMLADQISNKLAFKRVGLYIMQGSHKLWKPGKSRKKFSAWKTHGI